MLGFCALLLLPYFKVLNSNYDSMHTISGVLKHIIMCILGSRGRPGAVQQYELSVNRRPADEGPPPYSLPDGKMPIAAQRLAQLWKGQVCHSAMRDGGQWHHMLDNPKWLKSHDWYFLCGPFAR